jgi:hypothetical protein
MTQQLMDPSADKVPGQMLESRTTAAFTLTSYPNIVFYHFHKGGIHNEVTKVESVQGMVQKLPAHEVQHVLNSEGH